MIEQNPWKLFNSKRGERGVCGKCLILTIIIVDIWNNFFYKKSHRNRDSIFEGNARLTVNLGRQLSNKNLAKSLTKNQPTGPKANEIEIETKKSCLSIYRAVNRCYSTTTAGICLSSSVRASIRATRQTNNLWQIFSFNKVIANRIMYNNMPTLITNFN